MNTKDSMINPFDLLGVDEAASDTDVKKAYFQMQGDCIKNSLVVA